MESKYSPDADVIKHILRQMAEACHYLMTWNMAIESADDFLLDPEGQLKLAANCMMIETLGESVKKINRIDENFLNKNAPSIPWNKVMGMRNHIAHGYFNIDADIVWDTVKYEIPKLQAIIDRLLARI